MDGILLSNRSDENVNEKLSFDKFKKNDCRFLEDRYKRYLWTIQEWSRIIGRKINRPPHINTLYHEGFNAFFQGLYSASILTITATIELTLKAIVNLSLMSSNVNKNFKNVTKEAVKQEIISPELGSELHYLRQNTRNILTHDVGMASHMTVGWEKDPTSAAGHMLTDKRLDKLVPLQRDSQSLFASREVYAKEAIQLLFQVFQSVIASGKDWSNLV